VVATGANEFGIKGKIGDDGWLQVDGSGRRGSEFTLRVQNPEVNASGLDVEGFDLDFTGENALPLSSLDYPMDVDWEVRDDDEYWGSFWIPPDGNGQVITVELKKRRGGGGVTPDGFLLSCQSGDICLSNLYFDMAEFEAARDGCVSSGTYLDDSYSCSGGYICYYETLTAKSWIDPAPLRRTTC